ncbi:MAG: hypothetical protein L6V93_10960 [Clostridiales bacterium]|nr:MAG: hypothetical protein L6V93_10960 [Clostridiales bacterium]
MSIFDMGGRTKKFFCVCRFLTVPLPFFVYVYVSKIPYRRHFFASFRNFSACTAFYNAYIGF